MDEEYRKQELAKRDGPRDEGGMLEIIDKQRNYRDADDGKE
jgi:hypothetical protein